MTIPILFEDGEALVIDKPGGLPIEQPRAGGRSLEDHLEELKLGFQRPPVPVHRIDTDTSGCLLLARNPKALKRFAAAFENRLVEKTYIGLLAGEVAEESGTIELALSKISSASGGWKMIPAKKGKPAVTHWRRLAVEGGITAVEFRPVTGRTHQIRVHLSSFGFPIRGDSLYGPPDPDFPHYGLHCYQLTIPKPDQSPDLILKSLPPSYITAQFPQYMF